MREAILIAVSLIIGISTYYSLSLVLVSAKPVELSKVDEAIGKGYRFLVERLWDGERGAYRECPSPNPEGLDRNYWGDDNYLAYIFHTEYFRDEARVERIKAFLGTNPAGLDLGVRRWIVLSRDYRYFTPYGDNEHADLAALDGIFYARSGNMERAGELFNLIVSKMYNHESGFIEDRATPENGHEYYKLGLALILAAYVGNKTYAGLFAEKLLELQRGDGSWLTDDLDPGSTYPNSETMMIVLIALKTYREKILASDSILRESMKYIIATATAIATYVLLHELLKRSSIRSGSGGRRSRGDGS